MLVPNGGFIDRGTIFQPAYIKRQTDQQTFFFFFFQRQTQYLLLLPYGIGQISISKSYLTLTSVWFGT